MIKEELEREAEEYANHNDWFEFSANVNKIGNAIKTKMERAYLAAAEPREKRIAELEAQIEQLQKINNEQKETLKKVRVALIQERTANIMNYGKGGVEMFDSMFEILKGVSN